MASKKKEQARLEKWASKVTQALTKPEPAPGLRCSDCGKPLRGKPRSGAPRCPSCRDARSSGSVVEMAYHPITPAQGAELKIEQAEYLSPEETLRKMLALQAFHARYPEPLIDKTNLVADRLPQGARLDDSPLFREGQQHRAANGRPLKELRIGQGVHRPAPSGPPGTGQRGRPLVGVGRPSRAKPQPSHAARAYHWRKLARPIKVSTEDWELLRLATVEQMTGPQIAARLSGSVTSAAVRKRLQLVRAAVKAAN